MENEKDSEKTTDTAPTRAAIPLPQEGPPEAPVLCRSCGEDATSLDWRGLCAACAACPTCFTFGADPRKGASLQPAPHVRTDALGITRSSPKPGDAIWVRLTEAHPWTRDTIADTWIGGDIDRFRVDGEEGYRNWNDRNLWRWPQGFDPADAVEDSPSVPFAGRACAVPGCDTILGQEEVLAGKVFCDPHRRAGCYMRPGGAVTLPHSAPQTASPSPYSPTCIRAGCQRPATPGSQFCRPHTVAARSADLVHASPPLFDEVTWRLRSDSSSLRRAISDAFLHLTVGREKRWAACREALLGYPYIFEDVYEALQKEADRDLVEVLALLCEVL